QAAEAMGLTSTVLQDLGIVDHTIAEPDGGAHRDPELAALRVKEFLVKELQQLKKIPLDDLLEKRYQRLMSYGNM
ncbi:MAG: acetyl-CoA carboxylase carboxyl transferase subunit alpha, partial [Pseudomonadales bacterium]